jgi:hypothetical protein
MPVIAMRRIGLPDFRFLAAAPASYGEEAYCKEFARPSLAILESLIIMARAERIGTIYGLSLEKFNQRN